MFIFVLTKVIVKLKLIAYYCLTKLIQTVAKTIKGAIGDGTKTVYISVKPVKTLGVQTGVQVCHSPNPIEQQEVPMATALELEDGIDNENLTNIDDQLTAP